MVAVKGMKMPKSCMECLLFDDEYGDCNVMGEPKADATEQRAENCPLVEIVTCKDCRHRKGDICRNFRHFISGDFYCGNAEGKE